MKYYHHPPVVINIAPHRGFLLQNVKNVKRQIVKRIAKKSVASNGQGTESDKGQPPCQVQSYIQLLRILIIGHYTVYIFHQSLCLLEHEDDVAVMFHILETQGHALSIF